MMLTAVKSSTGLFFLVVFLRVLGLMLLSKPAGPGFGGPASSQRYSIDDCLLIYSGTEDYFCFKTQASGRERLMKSQGDCNVQTARTLRYDFSATDFDNNNNNNNINI